MKIVIQSIVLAIILSGSAWAGDYKIGYVNTERIFRESQMAIKAQKKLEKEFASREQDIQKQIKLARDLQTVMEKEGLTMSEADRSKRERDLANINRDIQRSQREFREDLNQRKNEEFAAVHERARKTILEIAEKEKYDVVLENVVYAGPRVDLTEKVLKVLDR